MSVGKALLPGELGRHVRPPVGGAPKVGIKIGNGRIEDTSNTLPARSVGLRSAACGGIVPILHDLGHGGGHAAGDSPHVIDERAKVVVIRQLVPVGLHQGRNDDGIQARLGVAFNQVFPLLLGFGALA